MASNALALLEGDTLRLRGVLDRAAVIALWPQLQALPAQLARLELGGFRSADNGLLLTVRQLELFKQRSATGADAALSRAERARRLAEIDRRLDELQRQTQHQARSRP